CDTLHCSLADKVRAVASAADELAQASHRLQRPDIGHLHYRDRFAVALADLDGLVHGVTAVILTAFRHYICDRPGERRRGWCGPAPATAARRQGEQCCTHSLSRMAPYPEHGKALRISKPACGCEWPR